MNIRCLVPIIVSILLLATWIGRWPSQAAPQKPPRDSLEIRQARIQLHLAEVNLQRVQQMNQRVARAVPADVVAEYQEDVEVARLRLQRLLDGKGEGDFAVWLRRAQAIARSAEVQWKSAVAVNRQAPGTVDTLDVERLRLRAELARMRLARGQELASQSREKQVQWQEEFLADEVQRLNEEVLRNPARAGPLWWY